MARPIRIEVAGGLYHVVARGNERKAIFRDDADRATYLSRLAHYRSKLGFRLLAYCLMDNHVHLAIQTGNEPLSRTMAGLQSSYTQYFNRRHDRAGHLFQGRYKAFLVEQERYALALVRYIHRNAVEAGIVERAERYAWSSDRYYRGRTPPEWLDRDEFLRLLAPRRASALARYRRLMGDSEEPEFAQVPTWGQAVKGDEAFADRVLGLVGEPRVVPRGLTLERIARCVAAAEGTTVREMRTAGRGRRESQARLVTAWLARRVGRISGARTASYFGRDTSTIAHGLERLKRQMEDTPSLRRQLENLERELRG